MQNFEAVMEKLKILTDAAKYDVSCSSSGTERRGQDGHLGSAAAMGPEGHDALKSFAHSLIGRTV